MVEIAEEEMVNDPRLIAPKRTTLDLKRGVAPVKGVLGAIETGWRGVLAPILTVGASDPPLLGAPPPGPYAMMLNATGCQVRLYGVDGKLVAELKKPRGKIVLVAPDGKLFSVAEGDVATPAAPQKAVEFLMVRMTSEYAKTI